MPECLMRATTEDFANSKIAIRARLIFAREFRDVGRERDFLPFQEIFVDRELDRLRELRATALRIKRPANRSGQCGRGDPDAPRESQLQRLFICQPLMMQIAIKTVRRGWREAGHVEGEMSKHKAESRKPEGTNHGPRA